MKYIITENQFHKLNEQLSLHTPMMATNLFGGVISNLNKLKKKYPNTFDTVASVGMWFIPYVGPYLSATYSSLVALDKIKKGDTTSGIIELITSPLVLMKTIRVLKIMGSQGETLKMLQLINKSGIPLLVSEGQEAFLKWGLEKFGTKFESFIQLLNDQNKMKSVLLQLKK